MTVARKLAGAVTVAGLLAIGAGVASSATAAADPPPPPPAPADPAAPAPPADAAPPPDAPPPPTVMGTMGAIVNQPANSPSGFDLLLSQNPVPALPGSQPATPNLTSVTKEPAYLFGPNMKLDQQGQQSMYSAGPTDMNAPNPTGRIDAFQRAHGLWHMGIGQMPQDQLGQPLPGTAAPPGSNLPVGTDWPGPDQPPAPPSGAPAPLPAPLTPAAPPG